MAQPSSAANSQKYDERDTMFARAARQPGTLQYADYYARRPELEAVDDELRGLTPLLAPGSVHYDPELGKEAEDYFRRIETYVPDAALVARWAERIRLTGSLYRTLRRMALELGAVAAGATRVDSAFVYSHRGRHDHHYGEEIATDLPWALVFLVEMDHRRMGTAPRAAVIAESARQYHRGASVSMTMVAALREAGIEARSHHDAHYDLILPPVAVAAGLGELGRNNILVADRYGSRVRIGAITTSEPLEQEHAVSLGVRYFCELCRKCAENCPSRALSDGPPIDVRGVVKWPTNVERCYRYWRTVGTDCGICMACCPFSHKSNWFHGAVRWAIKRSRLAAPMALRCDDLVYSRRWSKRRMHWL
jgi:hypothetical protein